MPTTKPQRCCAYRARHRAYEVNPVIGLIWTLLLATLPQHAEAAVSTCFGNSSNGRVVNAQQLPVSGTNFIAYGPEPVQAGRTYVHSLVHTIVVDAYRDLETLQPEKLFMYAETGLQQGGPFPPHKTHQNGTSVDFMVPVLDQRKKSVLIPSHAANRYGYDLEFDNAGRWQSLQIDFEAIAAHLFALHKAAKAHGVSLRRVIIAPEYHGFIRTSAYGKQLHNSVKLQKRRAWVRHDEHYHVDFDIHCEPFTRN